MLLCSRTFGASTFPFDNRKVVRHVIKYVPQIQDIHFCDTSPDLKHLHEARQVEPKKKQEILLEVVCRFSSQPVHNVKTFLSIVALML